MRINSNPSFFLAILLCIASCATNKNAKSNMEAKTIMEITTFQINLDADSMTFVKRDAQVESDFTSKQPGFIKRQSGVNDSGNYVVVVYWKSLKDADTSMNKFMGEASVADYAQMIDASTMKMSRYTMDKSFNAAESQFVEIMSFDVKPNTDMTTFDALNQKVETDFTAERTGFLQRLTGVSESGKQVVAVYWASKAASDAALQPFMEAPISKQFMQEMEPSSIVMGRYNFLGKF